jgi:hypothetical protein
MVLKSTADSRDGIPTRMSTGKLVTVRMACSSAPVRSPYSAARRGAFRGFVSQEWPSAYANAEAAVTSSQLADLHIRPHQSARLEDGDRFIDGTSSAICVVHQSHGQRECALCRGQPPLVSLELEIEHAPAFMLLGVEFDPMEFKICAAGQHTHCLEFLCRPQISMLTVWYMIKKYRRLECPTQYFD